MKTTIDIPEKELEDAMRFTHSATKREAVNIAVSEFNRRKRVEEVLKLLGTFPDFPTNEEIEAGQIAAEKEGRRGLG